MAHGWLDVEGVRVRWVRAGRTDGRPMVLLAHGAGAPLTSPFLVAVSEGLVQRGCVVARFHFPYMQRRVEEGTRRPPDRPPRCLATWQAMVDKARGWAGGGPMVLSGKSFGGRMASLWLAQTPPDARPGVCAAAYLGFPLHPPAKPGIERAAHLASIDVPQLFLSGTRDALATLPLLRSVVDPLADGCLQLVEGGDHSLARQRRDPLGGAGAWLDVLAAFVRRAAGC